MSVQYEEAVATLEQMFPEWDKDTLGTTTLCMIEDINVTFISVM
jgi:hypothetical protein